jgi:hypothetical protein
LTFVLHLGAITGFVDPPNASVWLDGSPTTTDSGWFNVSLLPGVYTVEVRSTGYTASAQNVTVTPGNVSMVTVSLTPLPIPSPTHSPPPSGSLPLSSTMIVGLGLAALAVVAIVVVLLWRTRRRRS